MTVNQTSNYNYIGCYSDNNPGRALTGLAPAAPAGGNTVDNCATRCTGYEYFGTEYSNECYCGNAIGAGSVLQTSADPTVNGCGMECGGNITEYCIFAFLHYPCSSESGQRILTQNLFRRRTKPVEYVPGQW